MSNAVIDPGWAHTFAVEWCAGWSSHDLDRILDHYSEDFEMASPLIVERGLDPSGVLRGKPAVRAYWAKALESASPPIAFELIAAYAGVRSIVIHYKSLGRRLVTEVLMFDEHGRVSRGSAHYGAAI